MTREDLFLAIGDVEEIRLARSEAMAPSDDAHWEDAAMSKQEYRKRGSIFRGLLIAAIVVTMLATTAFAYTGFVVYENPQAMLEAFFGEQPEPHGADCLCADCTATAPTFERETLDADTAMEEVAPYISKVGDSVVYEPMNYRITVDAHVYDPATGCGLVYYTLESLGKYTIEYHLQSDGEVWDLPGSKNLPCKEYLIQEESTATKLKIACYYICGDTKESCFRIGFAWEDTDLYGETVLEKHEEFLYLPLEGGGMKHHSLADEEIILSPIGLVIKSGLSGIKINTANEPKISSVVIRYADGSEYLVMNEDEGNVTYNYAYSLMELEQESRITYALNRVVDIDNVAAVVINGTEYPVD